MLAFDAQLGVGMRVLSCFAVKLGFAREFFRKGTIRDRQYQSTLRMLHYSQ